MPTLVIPIGVAGSGKSTYYQQHYSQFTKISADDYRIKINGSKQPVTATEPQVWQRVAQQLTQNIKQQHDVYYDNTNRSRKQRTVVYQQTKQHHYHVIAVWFVLPFTTLLTRDQQRQQPVGMQVQWHQLCSIDPPVCGVDCDQVITITVPMEIVNNHYQFSYHFMAHDQAVAKRYALQSQQNEHDLYHDQSIVAHDFAAFTLGVNSGNMQLATLAQWHDMGKIFTRSYDPMNARVHYYNHDVVSSYLFASYCVYHHCYDQLAMQTSQLIRWHMVPFNGGIGKKLQQREHLTPTMCQMLQQFHHIDVISS